MFLRRLTPRRYKLLGIPAGVWAGITLVAVLTSLGAGRKRASVTRTTQNLVVYKYDGQIGVFPSGAPPEMEQIASLQATPKLRQLGWPFVVAEHEVLLVSISSFTNPDEESNIVIDDIRDSLRRWMVLEVEDVGPLLSAPALAPREMTFEVSQRQVIGIGVVATIGFYVSLPLFIWAFNWWLSRIRIDVASDRRNTAIKSGMCPVCKYDIRDLPEPRCPECGENLASDHAGA